MIRLLKVMFAALGSSLLLGIVLIVLGVPSRHVLIASEVLLVELFSLYYWKPEVFHRIVRGMHILLDDAASRHTFYAGPHHTYPIRKAEDVQHALRLVGRAKNPEEVKRKVIAIAQHSGYAFHEEEDECDPEEVSLPKEAENDEKDIPHLVGHAADPAGRKSQHDVFDQFVLMQSWRASESNGYVPPEYENMQFMADWPPRE